MKKSILIALTVICLTSAGAFAHPIRDKIFYPPKAPLNISGINDASIIEVMTNDNHKLKGIFIPPKDNKPIILTFHGNASSAEGVLRAMKPISQAGYGIVGAELRGYSGNKGKPTQAGISLDADAFYQFAKQKAQNTPIIVFGHSLGGGVALDLALRHKLDLIVTYGTFISIDAFVPKSLRFLNKDKFDNLSAVKMLDEPLVIVHGVKDETIPVEHGKILYNAARDAKRDVAAVFIQNGRHSFDANEMLKIFENMEIHANKIKFRHEKNLDINEINQLP